MPSSGKSFGAVDPRDLRASWDAAQKKKNEDAIQDWQIIGPFKSNVDGAISLDQPTEVEDAFLKSEGVVDITAAYTASGQSISWKRASAGKGGLVDLVAEIAPSDYSFAYAYAEIESIHARETVLKCGSDDGIKIWLNGRVIHENDIMRGHAPGADTKNIYLQAGVNKIFVKISNYVAGWGFSVALPKANF